LQLNDLRLGQREVRLAASYRTNPSYGVTTGAPPRVMVQESAILSCQRAPAFLTLPVPNEPYIPIVGFVMRLFRSRGLPLLAPLEATDGL